MFWYTLPSLLAARVALCQDCPALGYGAQVHGPIEDGQLTRNCSKDTMDVVPCTSYNLTEVAATYRGVSTCQIASDKGTATRTIRLGTGKSDFFLLTSDDPFDGDVNYGHFEWTLEQLKYQSADLTGVTDNCLKLNQVWQRIRWLRLVAVEFEYAATLSLVQTFGVGSLPARIMELLPDFKQLGWQVDSIPFLDMVDVTMEGNSLNTTFTATNLEEFRDNYFSCDVHRTATIMVVQNLCLFPIQLELTLRPKMVERSAFCDLINRYYDLEEAGVLAVIVTLTFYGLCLLLVAAAFVKSPMFAKYRDVMQALGPRNLFFSGCEGRSFFFPVLLYSTSLMWINLFFYSPGQDVPRIGPFFGTFTFSGSPSTPLQGGVSASDTDGTTQRLWKIVAILAVSVALAPLGFAILMPSYQFPAHWFQRAGVRQSHGGRLGWLRNDQSRTFVATYALIMFNIELAVQYYSYLGNPLVIRDTWHWVTEAWLYYVHMGLVVAMDVYFVLLFLLPQGGAGVGARVRAWVVRRVERPEQQLLLLEGEFMAAVEAEEKRRGKGEPVGESSEKSAAGDGAGYKSNEKDVCSSTFSTVLQAPVKVAYAIRHEQRFRYSIWVMTSAIVTLHLLVFTFLRQIELHQGAYRCMKDAIQASDLDDLTNQDSSVYCLPSRDVDNAATQIENTYQQGVAMVAQVQSVVDRIDDVQLTSEFAQLTSAYEDMEIAVDVASLNPRLCGWGPCLLGTCVCKPSFKSNNPFHLFLWLISQQDKTGVNHTIEQCVDSYAAAFYISYTCGLIFGIYTVLRVMAQYKHVTMTRQNPKFLLRNRMMAAVQQRMGSDNVVAQELREEKGHILAFHEITSSSQFAALQVSTSYLTLVILGYLGTAGLTALFCEYFWTKIVVRAIPYLATSGIILVINSGLNQVATWTLRPGAKEVSQPGWWLFIYSLLTPVNMITGLLLAAIRISLLLILSVLDVSRVDRSMLPHMRQLDKGYMGFYGMLLLQEGFGRYFKVSREDRELFTRQDKEERQKKKEQRGNMCSCCGRSKPSADLTDITQISDEESPPQASSKAVPQL